MNPQIRDVRVQSRAVSNLITFDGTPGNAAKLKYDVSMPGRFRGQRLIYLDLELEESSVRPDAGAVTSSALDLDWRVDSSGTWAYNGLAARDLWFNKVYEAYDSFQGDVKAFGHFLGFANTLDVPSQQALYQAIRSTAYAEAPDSVGRLAPVTPEDVRAAGKAINPNLGWEAPGMGDIETPVSAGLSHLVALYGRFVDGMKSGQLVLPTKTWDGRVETTSVDAVAVLSTSVSDLHFFLVETYGISSFLGDYGLGQTVSTFTLLPGEETAIRVNTWKTDSSNMTSSTSIVDSYDASSATRFNKSVQLETTDKKTRNNKKSWHAEAEVSAKWGWGSAKVSGGASGESQSSRDQFARSVTDAVQEHVADASSHRTNSVSLASDQQISTGAETSSERTIRNVNLRRVLNFVFRELNQEYKTVVHLIETKIAVATSTVDSYREVPVAGIRPLMESILVADKVEGACQRVLKMMGTVMSGDGTPVRTLEKLVSQSDGSFSVEDASPDRRTGDWEVPPPDGSFVYRWKRGPLAQDEESSPVTGIVMAETRVVVPTADLVVEALLGQADALDEFALRSQHEQTESTFLENEKLRLALSTLEGIDDLEKRAAAWALMFNPARIDRADISGRLPSA
jgi:hypothetical protein